MSTTILLPAPIGAELGGGIYVGPHFQPGGSVRHLVASHKSLDARGWEAACTALSGLRIDGFDDWFLPSKDELTIALLNARDKFDKAIHWTSTPYDDHYAWAVGFEGGSVYIDPRTNEFRVRPFRSHLFTPSPLSQVEVDKQHHQLAYDTLIDHSGPARAMLELITSTGGDTAFDCLEDEQRQAYLHALFHHVASVDDVLRDIGGAKS